MLISAKLSGSFSCATSFEDHCQKTRLISICRHNILSLKKKKSFQGNRDENNDVNFVNIEILLFNLLLLPLPSMSQYLVNVWLI